MACCVSGTGAGGERRCSEMEPVKNFAGEDALASKVKNISKGQKIGWVRGCAFIGVLCLEL